MTPQLTAAIAGPPRRDPSPVCLWRHVPLRGDRLVPPHDPRQHPGRPAELDVERQPGAKGRRVRRRAGRVDRRGAAPKQAGAEVVLLATYPLVARASFSTESRDGLRPYSGSFGFGDFVGSRGRSNTTRAMRGSAWNGRSWNPGSRPVPPTDIRRSSTTSARSSSTIRSGSATGPRWAARSTPVPSWDG